MNRWILVKKEYGKRSAPADLLLGPDKSYCGNRV